MKMRFASKLPNFQPFLTTGGLDHFRRKKRFQKAVRYRAAN